MDTLIKKIKDSDISFERTEYTDLGEKIKKAREEKIKGQLITVNPDNIW